MNPIFTILSNITHDIVVHRIHNLVAITTSLPNSENFNSQPHIHYVNQYTIREKKIRVGEGVALNHTSEPRAAAARSRT